MHQIINIFAFFFFTLPWVSCDKNEVTVNDIPKRNCIVNGIDTCIIAQSITQIATVDVNKINQTIHSFGASGCWGIKYVGENWPLEKKNRVADLLFSKEFDADGNPKGIGLSMWRINIGAGSLEQGESSKIGSPWRREECFQNAKGEYNWNKQKGHQWFAKAAKDRGVENLMLFSIAAPVHMSKNGFASSNSDVNLNLKDDMYDDFADFMAEVCKYFTTNGMPINYISPLNEPQWNWSFGDNGKASQEGTPATNAQCFQVIKELDKSLTAKNLNTKIAFGEAGSHNYVFQRVSNNPDRSDVFNYFWNPNLSTYIGNMPSVEKVISSHSYFAQSNTAALVSNRVNLKNRIQAINPSINYWQSEYCVLSNEDNTAGPTRDLGMPTALYIARVIHMDLALANATSWQWWLAVSPSDYKDGLVYIADVNGTMGELNQTTMDGIVYPSKMLWAVGNYSKFIRPGMVRVDVTSNVYSDPAIAASGTMISSYKNLTTNELVTVVLNLSNQVETIKLNGVNFKSNKLKSYTTSNIDNLKKRDVDFNGNLVVEPKSITTFVGTL
jgi:O-glycosyl hydrolase